MPELSDQHNYFPIFLNTIKANIIQSFSIYIKMKSRYILYHAGGDRLTEEIINKLIANKIQIVYVSQNERDSYNKYLISILGALVKDQSKSVKERSEIVNYSIRSIAQHFFTNPNKDTFPCFKESVSHMADFILDNDEAIFNLIGLMTNNFENYVHSINVCVFGTGLAKLMLSHDSRHDLKKIAIGLFLHDIGISTIPLTVIKKANPLNHKEWNIVKQHPVEGFKLLNKLTPLTDEMRIIVMQHHERVSGRGYPKGLKGDQVHDYAKICSIADSFEALTSQRPYRKTLEGSFQALLILKNEMREELNPFMFNNFIKLFCKTMEKSA
ncbi:HD-GYP domain-containing protein [Candidatus Latescibacterota bacterium]